MGKPLMEVFEMDKVPDKEWEPSWYKGEVKVRYDLQWTSYEAGFYAGAANPDVNPKDAWEEWWEEKGR